jgi:hypothetical protein
VVSTNGRIEEGFVVSEEGVFVQVQQQEVVVEEEISTQRLLGSRTFKGPGNRALGL